MQRYYVVVGWTNALLPTDRAAWSDADGTTSRSLDAVALPADHRAWAWVDEWHVDTRGACDADGWAYAVDFSLSASLASWGCAPAAADLCRRRRWVRHRVCTHDALEPLSDVEQGRRHVERLKRAHGVKQAHQEAERQRAATEKKKEAAKAAARLGF